MWGQARSSVDAPRVQNPIHRTTSDSSAARNRNSRNRLRENRSHGLAGELLENHRLYPDRLQPGIRPGYPRDDRLLRGRARELPEGCIGRRGPDADGAVFCVRRAGGRISHTLRLVANPSVICRGCTNSAFRADESSFSSHDGVIRFIRENAGPASVRRTLARRSGGVEPDSQHQLPAAR